MEYLGKTYPKATAPAIANPKAADFPRPLAAVKATVLLRVFSEMASMNLRTPLACQGGKKPSRQEIWMEKDINENRHKAGKERLLIGIIQQ